MRIFSFGIYKCIGTIFPLYFLSNQNLSEYMTKPYIQNPEEEYVGFDALL